MSVEHYICCHQCKKKVHIGCVGFSGYQFWSGEESVMRSLHNMLSDCFLHMQHIGYIDENMHEDYEELK